MSWYHREIVDVLDVSYEVARMMIIEYLKSIGDRKVYISEIVEKLNLDIEQVKDIMDELKGN